MSLCFNADVYTLLFVGIFACMIERMKTLSITTKKGGAGKTAIATSIAAIAAGEGLNVAIIDIDPQASACVWADVRDADDSVPSVAVVSVAPSRLDKEIEKCQKAKIALCIVDTAPSADSGLLAAVRAGDLCLLPSRPGLADLAALKDTVQLLNERNAATVLNAVTTKALKIEGVRSLEGLDLPVAPVAIWQRVAWSHAFSGGWGVSEYEPKGKAADELRRLWQWIKQELELS